MVLTKIFIIVCICLSIDTMKNNNNSVAEILNVISPYMRLTVDNTDPNIARPVKLYIHGIKSRD